MKVVVNKCWGGFSLSLKAIKEYLKLKGYKASFYIEKGEWKSNKQSVYRKVDENYNGHKIVWIFKRDKGKEFSEKLDDNPDYFTDKDIKRNDIDLVKVVEKLKDKASGRFARLRIVEIPKCVKWEIDNYDGMEKVNEKHQSWG